MKAILITTAITLLSLVSSSCLSQPIAQISQTPSANGNNPSSTTPVTSINPYSTERTPTTPPQTTAPTPLPTPPIPRKGPTPAPEWFNLESKATFTKQNYGLGETVVFQTSFTNKDTTEGVISPFPPAVAIRMPSLPAKGVLADTRNAEITIWSFSGGSETVTLQPGETKTARFSWDQKKSDGGQVLPGWYQIVTSPMGRRAAYIGQKALSMGYGNFLIQYPQGAMQKTITPNQTKTITGLHVKWVRVDGSVGYDYVVDVAITLERIELNEQGARFYAWASSPNWPFPSQTNVPPGPLSSKYANPWFGSLSRAEYAVDSVIKDARTPSGQYLADGVRWSWGTELMFPIDPVPSDAKKLSFKIPRFGEWEGPWEFEVPLQ